MNRLDAPFLPKPVIIIPAHLASQRLPRKILADIAGEPMIVHVWRQACSAQLGPVFVATADPEIESAVTRAGGEVILTRADHISGTDRVWDAVTRLDPQRMYDIVINLQGDLPTLPGHYLSLLVKALEEESVEIATLAAELEDTAHKHYPHIVKIVASPHSDRLRPLYFTRAPAPFGAGPMYQHIGIYAYRRKALERFVQLPPSALECRESLEQLRAVEAGMHLAAHIVPQAPLSVDTSQQLEDVRQYIARRAA